MPFLSVIIPLYNKELYIGTTIHSVLNQSFDDFEIIVVNDGSKDKSLQVVNGIQDGRIRIINQQNAGVSAARNRGMNEAQGEYLFFLDADDILLDGAFEVCNELRRINSDIFAASFIEKNTKGIIVKQNINIAQGNVTDPYKAFFCKSLYLRTGSIFIKRDIALIAGAMRSDISLYEDLEWLLRLLEVSSVYSSPQVILEYVRYENGLSSKLPDISKDFAGIISLDGLQPKYRKKLVGDFIFRRFLVRLRRRDWKGLKVILKNNGVGIFYAMYCFFYRILITGSYRM